MEKLKMESKDKVQGNIEKIRELFPNAVTEVLRDGKPTLAVDFDVLKQEMSGTLIDDKEERYQFTWPDKKKSILLANTPINATLRPCKEESVNFDTTENLYIEGDNLDVLKLLQETYLGKIKMIYIDPPYNTGNDFVYNDDFALESEEYLGNSGQYDDQGNRLVQNTESNGRFHTDWLNMIYPRLKVAKDLLSDDGVICISIDDNEENNLEKICDEIFGEKNRIGLFTILSNPRGSQNSNFVSNIHEYILLYAKNILFVNISGIEQSDKIVSEFNQQDSSGRKYRLIGLRKRGGAWKRSDRPLMFYPIYVNPKNGRVSLDKTEDFSIEVLPKRPTGEESRWCWGKTKFLEENHLLIGKQINRKGEVEVWDIFKKDYLDNDDGEQKTAKVKTIWLEKETNYQNAKNEIKALFGNSEVFDYPKPTYIIEKLSKMFLEEGDYVLDFFAGSATTAHAIMQLNIEDSGCRKYILVQLPEKCNEKSEAYKAGYKTICEIGKERIRRAGQKLHDDDERIKIYINDIDAVLNNKSIKLSLELLAYDTQKLYVENEDAPEVQQDYLYNKIIEIINGETKLYDEDKLFDKYFDQLQKPVSRLADLLSGLIYGVDVGFRVLKLDSSNMKDVYYKPQDYSQSLLDSLESNIKEGRTPLDLLFQVMLDLGKPLSAKIEEKTIRVHMPIVGGSKYYNAELKTNDRFYKVYYVDGNDLIACFDEGITESVIKEIAQQKPLYAVFRDSGLSSDSTSTNFDQIFATYSPNTTRRVL